MDRTKSDPVDELRRENARLRQELDRAQRDRTRLERENARLKEELEAARRTGARQASPFSKGPPRRRPGRPGRKTGARHGRPGQRRVPAAVHETVDVPVPPTCPHCGDVVQETHVATQYQEDLPAVTPVVRRFDVHIGACRACHRRVQGRDPRQTSDALGAAAVQIGPHAITLAVSLNKAFGVSFGKVAALFRARVGLQVTPSALVRAVHRAAARGQPTYDALCATGRTSPVVVPDETGWKVAAVLQWLWVFATPRTTVYRIQPGRGFPEAAAVLGADFAGALIRDGWAPYRQFTDAFHQTCVAHLLRRARTLRRDHPTARLPARVSRILHQALAVRDRRTAGTITPHGVDVARGHLFNQLTAALAQPSAIPAVARFAKHLTTELPTIFSFLVDPALDATNWRAEQAIRPAVVTRKMCGGGNRTAHGAESQQILTSILRTAQQRDLDTDAVLTTLLRAPTPIVSPHFYPITPSVH